MTYLLIKLATFYRKTVPSTSVYTETSVVVSVCRQIGGFGRRHQEHKELVDLLNQ